ncbi:MAG: hypothetical protein GOVbin962_44 [Prokaryotic dsDNA virus sp.]|nr:MAG: hypothetical protein GOVbin962_44 [Prokaryotic dsDNA virus sp.]|tara:strand:+ start:48349 stop:50691 length:2343 start_codon:yes stop_codon:yes gene_type:complete
MAIQFLNALNIDGTVTATINADANDGYDGILVSTSGLIERRTKAEILTDIGAGTMSSFTVSADTNTATTTITNGETLSLVGGSGVSTVSNPDGTITISASGSSYTKWVLAGDTGTNQDIDDGDTATFSGVFGITTEGKNTDTLEIGFPIGSFTAGTVAANDFIAIADVNDANAIKKVTAQSIADLAPQGDITEVGAATVSEELGIKVTSGTGPIPKVGLDIVGQTALATAATGDSLLIYDLDTTTNKKITVANLLAAAPQGDVTSVIPSTADAKLGITIANQSGPIPEVGVDIVGQTSLGTGADGDLLLIYDLDATKNKQISLSDLKTYIDPITTINQGSGIKVTTAGETATVAVDYSATGIIADATSGASVTIADGDLILLQDINASSAATAVVRVTASQLKTYIGADNYGSWTLAGNSGTNQTIGSTNTATIEGQAQDAAQAGIATVGTNTDILKVNLDLAKIQTASAFDDPDTDMLVYYDSNNQINQKIYVSDAHLNDFGAPTAALSIGSQVLTNVANGSNATDGVNLGQVEALVSGSSLFRGGYNASTGQTTDLSPNGAINGASNIATALGDFYAVTVAGTQLGTALEPGDLIFANTAIAANSNPANSLFTIVQSGQSIAGSGATDGATTKGVAGFDNDNFTVSSNGWVQLITRSTSGSYGSASKTVSLTLDDDGITTAASEQDIDITASQVSDFCTAVSTCIASNEQYAADIGGATSIAVNHGLATRDVMVQLYDLTSYETVYADVERNTAAQVTVKFTTAPGANSIRILITKVS